MNFVKSNMIKLSLVLLALMATSTGFAVNITSTGTSSNWNDVNAWSTAQVPTAADDVTILENHTVNGPAATIAFASLTVASSVSGDGVFTTVNTTITGAGIITVDGVYIINGNTRGGKP